MNGTSMLHTLEMLRTPPRITAAARSISTAPLTLVLMPYEACIMVEMAFACTVQPMPNAAMAVNTANRMPILRHPRPRSNVYIGPPSMCPFSDFTRYFMASRASEYFVEMPNTPVSQHQNTAPGPPNATAVATPIILPVPIVAARAVASAPNCDTSPFCDLSRCTERRMAVKSLRCGKRRRTDRKTWVPSSSTIIGQPQRYELSVAKKSLTLSIFICFQCYPTTVNEYRLYNKAITKYFIKRCKVIKSYAKTFGSYLYLHYICSR